jgi:hypothetical protein
MRAALGGPAPPDRGEDRPENNLRDSHLPRLPPLSAKLSRAMNTIQKVGGPGVFRLA